MYICTHARGERDRETEIKRIKIYKTKTYKWDDQSILYTAQDSLRVKGGEILIMTWG